MGLKSSELNEKYIERVASYFNGLHERVGVLVEMAREVDHPTEEMITAARDLYECISDILVKAAELLELLYTSESDEDDPGAWLLTHVPVV